MPAYILDANVLAALYVPDPASHEVEALLERLGERAATLHAPELALLEVANVRWKRVRRRELTAADAMAGIADLALAPIELHPASVIARRALALALAAYDAAYLAVATHVGATVVTTDAGLQRLGTEAGLPVKEPSAIR